MIINTDNIVSMSDANQNFTNVAKKVDENGSAVIMKNNKPKYVITKIEESTNDIILTEDEKLEVIAKRILKEHKRAFEVLGQ